MNQQKNINSRNSDDDENSSSNNNNNNNKSSSNNVGLLQWTNERHSNFLRVMEASFVRNMLKRSNNNTITTHQHKSSKLDRFVPDISESTLDLHRSDRVSRSWNRQKERPTIRPYKISHDQVVPELENKAGDVKK